MDEFCDVSNRIKQKAHKMQQISKDTSKICRLCAQLINGKVKNVFNVVDLVQKINYALPINIHLGDGLTNFICSHCEIKVHSFHSFVCEVAKADKQLRLKERSPNDQVSKTIEEIFGTDSDEEQMPAMVTVKSPSLDVEEPKRLKTEATIPDPEINHKNICQKCEAAFPDFSTLLEHYKVVHGNSRLQSPETNFVFTAKDEKHIRDRIQDDSNDTPVICYKCDKIFLNQETLLKHRRNKHSSKVCSYCWMTFESEAGFQLHMQNHNMSNEHQCIYCQRTYQTARGLKRHTLNHHSGEITLLMENVITSD